MQTATAAWLAAVQQSHVTPVLYVELIGANVAFASRTIAATPLWRADQGLLADAGVVADEARAWRTLLAPYEQALGRITQALDERSNASRISGTSVQLLNQGKLSDLMDRVVLDNGAVQISLGFAGLGPEHNLVLLTGVIDDYSWSIDTLQLDVTDDSFRVHKHLSTYVGSRFFPGTPRAARGRAIPICIGRQTGIEAIPVQGDATGTLAFALGTADTALFLTEFDAPFPESGSLNIAGETSVTYSSRLAVVLNGISYLRLSGLTRATPQAHAASGAVTLAGPSYRYLVGYEVKEVTAVRAGEVLLDPSAYTVTRADESADRPVTILAFATPPGGAVTVDADGINAQPLQGPVNGDFETADLTGWTPSAAASAVVTSGATRLGVYKAELTGSADAWEDLANDFATEPGRVYTLSLEYRDTLSAANLLTNGGFETGDLSGWTADPTTNYWWPPHPEYAIPAVSQGISQVNPSTGETLHAGVGEGQWALTIRAHPDTEPLPPENGSVYAKTFTYSFYQDVATIPGATYSFSLSWLGYYIKLYASLPGHVLGSRTPLQDLWQNMLGYRLSTPDGTTVYAGSWFLPSLQDSGTWRTIPPAVFTATAETTRVLVSVRSSSNYSLPMPVSIDQIVLTPTSVFPSSRSAFLLGTPEDPTAYQQAELPQRYSWDMAELAFQAQSPTTRVTLRSQWAQSAAASWFDNVKLHDAGRNPADAIAYVIDTYLPDMVRNQASFTDAYQRLSGWQFGGYLPDPGESKALLERMADQCKSDLVTHADGEVHLVTFDEQRPTVATFTTGNILEDTFRAHRETLDNLSTEVYVYFGLRSGASRTSPASYQGVTYATPDATTHPSAPLDLLCSAAHAIFRRTRRLDVFADMIRDLDTANRLLSHKVTQHTTRHDEVALSTSLAAAPVQVADMVAVSHPWLHGGQPQFCQVRERSIRGVEVSFGLRTVRQAGFYESWEPPAPGIPVVVHHETWAPDTTPPNFTYTEQWEPPTSTPSTIWAETWES